MPVKLALRTDILATTRLLPVAALRAFLGRVGFIDFLDCDSSELGFVLDHSSKLAIGPLMQPLIHSAAVVNSITDAACVADSNRRDTSLKEHLHDLPAQFVQKVRDLIVDVAELLVLRLNEPRPAIRAAFFAVDFRIELGFEPVLVVTQGAKLAAVDREGARACEDSGKVLLSEIDSSDLVSGGSINRFCVILSADNKPAGTLPDLDRMRLFIDGPIDQNRVLSAFCGETKHTIISERDTLVGPSEYVAGFVAAARRVAFAVALVPGADRSVELLDDFLGCLGRQDIVTFAVPPTHSRLTEPVVLPVDSSPVPRADPIPQVRRGAGQPLQPVGALNVEFASEVHALRLIFDVLLYDRLACLAGRRNEVAPRPERRKPVQMIKLLSQNVSTRSFEPVNHLVRSMACVCLNKEVNMIGANCQRAYLPVVFFGHLAEHLFQSIRYLVFQNRSPSLWAPYEMVFHRVDGVSASAVWFFVDWHHSINRTPSVVFRREYSPVELAFSLLRRSPCISRLGAGGSCCSFAHPQYSKLPTAPAGGASGRGWRRPRGRP